MQVGIFKSTNDSVLHVILLYKAQSVKIHVHFSCVFAVTSTGINPATCTSLTMLQAMVELNRTWVYLP